MTNKSDTEVFELGYIGTLGEFFEGKFKNFHRGSKEDISWTIRDSDYIKDL